MLVLNSERSKKAISAIMVLSFVFSVNIFSDRNKTLNFKYLPMLGDKSFT